MSGYVDERGHGERTKETEKMIVKQQKRIHRGCSFADSNGFVPVEAIMPSF